MLQSRGGFREYREGWKRPQGERLFPRRPRRYQGRSAGAPQLLWPCQAGTALRKHMFAPAAILSSPPPLPSDTAVTFLSYRHRRPSKIFNAILNIHLQEQNQVPLDPVVDNVTTRRLWQQKLVRAASCSWLEAAVPSIEIAGRLDTRNYLEGSRGRGGEKGGGGRGMSC
jgi:hypothetical protein